MLDAVAPCQSGLVLAIVVGLVWALVLAEDGHTVLMSSEAAVEQVHWDEGGARSGTEFEASPLSQKVAPDPGSLFHLMAEPFEISEVLQNSHCFHFLASRHDQQVAHFWQCHHFRKCEDQCEALLSSLVLAILQLGFRLGIEAFAEDDVVAVISVDFVAVAADAVA